MSLFGKKGGEGIHLLLILFIGLAACAATPELIVESDDWVFERKALNIEIEASADLNVRSGRPHSLSLGIFQLNNTNTFSALTATRAGAVEMLNKGKIDETVASYERISVQPGEHKVIWVDRAQTARYVGVIAGYFKLNPKLDIYLFPIPIEATKRGLIEQLLVTFKLIANEAKALPGKIFLDIDLGRLGTRRMQDITEKVGSST